MSTNAVEEGTAPIERRSASVLDGVVQQPHLAVVVGRAEKVEKPLRRIDAAIAIA